MKKIQNFKLYTTIIFYVAIIATTLYSMFNVNTLHGVYLDNPAGFNESSNLIKQSVDAFKPSMILLIASLIFLAVRFIVLLNKGKRIDLLSIVYMALCFYGLYEVFSGKYNLAVYTKETYAQFLNNASRPIYISIIIFGFFILYPILYKLIDRFEEKLYSGLLK